GPTPWPPSGHPSSSSGASSFVLLAVVRGKSSRQLLQRSGPPALVAARRFVAVQERMNQRELGSALDRAKPDFQPRDPAVLLEGPVHDPAPAHDHALGSRDLEEFAGALVLEAVRGAEARAKAAADAPVRFDEDRRIVVRPPPGADTLRRHERLEDDRRPRGDPADERHLAHRLSCALASA